MLISPVPHFGKVKIQYIHASLVPNHFHILLCLLVACFCAIVMNFQIFQAATFMLIQFHTLAGVTVPPGEPGLSCSPTHIVIWATPSGSAPSWGGSLDFFIQGFPLRWFVVSSDRDVQVCGSLPSTQEPVRKAVSLSDRHHCDMGPKQHLKRSSFFSPSLRMSSFPDRVLPTYLALKPSQSREDF